VVCSFAEKELVWTSPVDLGILLLGNYVEQDGESGNRMTLKPLEGRLYYLEG